MLRITEFTQDSTGALTAPHLIITLTGRALDLGPVSTELFAELDVAVDAASGAYYTAAADWANAHGADICNDLAIALQAAGCADGEYCANEVRFTWRSTRFGVARHDASLMVTWEYAAPLPWYFRYELVDYSFSGAAVATQILDNLAGLIAEYPPLPADRQPTYVEVGAAGWIWRRLDSGSSLAAPEVAAVFNTGKYEYEPVRVPVLVLEILRQAEKGKYLGQRQERMRREPQFAKWYLAYGQALRAPAPEPPAPTSVFLQ